MRKLTFFLLIALIAPSFVDAQDKLASEADEKAVWQKKFEQLGTILPTPNVYRTASGAPGAAYWQQRADYDISIVLDDKKQVISGQELITYYNNSPDVLRYLWLQLDQNVRAPDSETFRTEDMGGTLKNGISDSLSSIRLVRRLGLPASDFVGGFAIAEVKDTKGNALPYTINKTMLRIELPEPLRPSERFAFEVAFSYNINNRMEDGGRSGYEYFPENDNYLYTIAQFYPRVAVYDDVEGWQNKQFLGSGEFALSFGNFQLSLNLPSDYVVASTGVLKNPRRVLGEAHLRRLQNAKKSFEKPVLIVTEAEARTLEAAPKSENRKTWVFRADNVRDFAFAASRKFIWDAQAVQLKNKVVLAMSFYSKEGNPLWEQESTRAVVNTLKTYSKYTIDYPYPVAISVHTAAIGMEYPMICFNFGRPNPDGSFSDQLKWDMIAVIIHEVGHNFFPMIINSDERQWTWMDEGLNSFVESLTEIEEYPDMPVRRGTPQTIVRYMGGDKEFIRPIMTNSEQIIQFGNNAYSKPSAALHLLRETIMGRPFFDYAFKEYARRWAFKKPTPADFFRTMEDASAVDLDWFFRGWFYTTDHVDVSVDHVRWFKMKKNEENPERPALVEANIGKEGTSQLGKPEKEFVLVPTDDDTYRRFEFRSRFDELYLKNRYQDKNFYLVSFKNVGGLVTPIILQWQYADGTTEIEKVPAEIWRKHETRAARLFVKDKQVVGIVFDPNEELADTNLENNVFPRADSPSKVEEFKQKNQK